MARVPMTSALSQPAWLPRTRPHTIPSAPTLIRASPRTSSELSGPKPSSILRSTSGIEISPIGTLIQKIHCHARPSTIAPPTSGPLATARPVIALKMPIAAPRFWVERRAEQGQAERHDQGRAGALDGARRDQGADVGRERAGRRSRREEPEPEGVEPAAAEAVAERRR